MEKFAYFNGNIIKERDINISPYDLGFMRGYGVFDALKIVKNKPFLLKEHWQRLNSSARDLNLEMPFELEKFSEIIEELLTKNKNLQSFIKTIITGGISENGLVANNKPTVLILNNDLKSVAPKNDIYKIGGALITLNFQRFLPQAKTLNYIMAVKNQELKIKNNAEEILYTNKGNVLECATSNIFIVKDKKLITAMKNILLGTTRNLILKLAGENKIIVLERDIAISELMSAEEVFLTGSFKDILPIVKIDDKIIGSGKVGPVTKKISKILKDFMLGY